MGKIMLKTTEPVAILSMREIENLINAAVKKAVEETILAVGYRTVSSSNDQNIHPRPYIDGSILRISQVKDIVGLSSASIYRLIKAGDFPAPIKLGKHASGWQDSTVRAWINARDQASPTPALATR